MSRSALASLAFVLSLLGGCASDSNVPPASAGEAETVETGGMNGIGICNAERVQSLIGQPISPRILQQSAYLSGARTVRALRPDQVVTQEYSSQRLNLRVDDKNIITSISCG